MGSGLLWSTDLKRKEFVASKKKKRKKSIIRCGGRLGEREQKDYLGIF